MTNSNQDDIKSVINDSISQSSTPKEEEETLKALDNKNNKHKLIWTVQIEELLRRWGDISACYKWLHDESFRVYKNSNYWYSIPIILLSTIAGGLNLSLTGYVPAEYLSVSQAGIGALNIFTGVLTTLQNFFKYAQLSESHANASQGWSKIQRNIEVELKLEKEFRTDADRFLRDCRRDYDRLIEQSPPIPKDIIKKFKKKFRDENNLIRPDIVDKISHTDVYREPLKEIQINIPVEKEEIKVINVDELKNMLVDDSINHHYHPHTKNTIHTHTNYIQRKSINQPTIKYNNNWGATSNWSTNLNTNNLDTNTREQSKSVIEDMPANRPKIKDLIKKFTDADDIFEKKKQLLIDITNQNNNKEEVKEEIIDEIIDEIKSKNKEESKEENKEESKEEIKSESKEEIKSESKEEIKSEINDLLPINIKYNNYIPGVFSLSSSLYNLNKKK